MANAEIKGGITTHLSDKLLAKQALFKGTLYFFLFTVLGLAILFFVTNTPQTLQALKHLELGFFIIAVILSFLDMLLGGWRNHIFIRKIKPGVSTWLCWRANVANIFLGAITPSQSGGGPAQIYILFRAGISIAKAMSVCIINFIVTLIFFLIFAIFALCVVRGEFSQSAIRYLIEYGFVTFITLFGLIFLTIWKPEYLAKVIFKLPHFIWRGKWHWQNRVEKLKNKLLSSLKSYKDQCNYFLKSQPKIVFYSVVITCLLYVNKFALAYFLMRGLGINGDFFVMISIQTLLFFILYFSPTPGGSGIAELSIAGLMTILLPKHLLSIFALLHRFFLLYLPAGLGGLILLIELKKQHREISIPNCDTDFFHQHS